MPSLQFAPGAVVTIRRERWRIVAVSRAGGGARIDVTRLNPRTPPSATFFTPFDDVDSGRDHRRPRRVRRQRWHAAVRAARAHAEHLDLPLTALAADIHVLPYQLEPLLAMRNGARRVLIADAVGLGKTIQAGLIVAEVLRRGEARRVLIAAPSHLCRQWIDELRARLNVAADLADAATLATLCADLPRDINPWPVCAVWVGSLDFLKQSHVLQGMPPDPWDLVVIDEAHMVTGHSDRRAAAHALAANARRVLLLTATPLSGVDDGRVLTGIGALAPREPLTVFRRTRADVGLPSRRRQRRLLVRPSDVERHAFDVLHAFSRAALAAGTGSTADATQLLVSVLTKRALSTFPALTLSADRRLAHLSGAASAIADVVQPSLDFGDGDDAAITVTIGMPVERERIWMRRIRAAAAAAAMASRKIARLTRLLSRTSEAVIVFTEFRDSLDAVATMLQRDRHRVAIAHGGLSPAHLQTSLDTFRSGEARILLATDVASQGLNLHQSARWIIHLDLPWNPIRLEQRAGRVDRLGQGRDVHVTLLVLNHARDLAFEARLTARADAAADHAALPGEIRWRRRARAAAALLLRRRAWAAVWRGPEIHGRPLAARGGTDIWAHDIDGAETLVVSDVARGGALWTSGASEHAQASQFVRARGRRVARVLATRAQRAAIVERALRARLDAGVEQPALPGSQTAERVRNIGQHAAAVVAARAACDERIAVLERASAEPPLIIVTRLRFTGG